jgi:FAD/FMN-containing dehydrogenase
VKSGGHATNPGFSSTTGVQIAMSRFNNVIYDPDTQTVRVGTGLTWDDVYSTLDNYNVTVLGGRVSGIGVGGLMLGGGT